MRRTLSVVVWLSALGCLLLPTSVEAAPITVDYIDSAGRDWASLVETENVSWNQLNAACSQDGLTPCTNDIGTLETTGWTWATRDQVRDLFIELGVPALGLADYVHDETSSTWAPAATPGAFDPTSASGSSRIVRGWTSTSPDLGTSGYVASIQDDLAPFFDLDLAHLAVFLNADFSNDTHGAWLFRPAVAAVPEPTSMLLLGTGLVGLATRRYRRKRS